LGQKAATMKRIGIALLLLACCAVSRAHAQAPSLITWWYSPRAVGITFDAAGHVIVADHGAPIQIKTYQPDGTLISQWGSYGSDTSSVNEPYFIATDANGHLFVQEESISNVNQSPAQEFLLDGTFVGRVGFYGFHADGSTITGPGAIWSADGIAVDAAGLVYVPDMDYRRTQVFSNDRVYLREWPSLGGAIAIDAWGHAFQMEGDAMVRKYDAATGALLAQWGGAGSGPGQFDQPEGIAVDPAGNVYVADTYNHRIQVFDGNGAFLAQWGGFGYQPGQFYRPMGVAVGPDGRIYVGDTWNGRVQVFGSVPTATRASTWGSLKARYR